MTSSIHRRVLCDTIVKSGGYMKGQFTLKSGEESDTYIDCRRSFLSSFWLSNIVPAYVDEIRDDLNVHTLLCGVPTSGLVLVGGLLSRLAVHRDVRACYLRPEIKDHGTKQKFEGDVRKNDEVILLDDVFTSGATIRSAMTDLFMRGLPVKKIVVLLDRSCGQFDKLDGVSFTRLLHIEDLERFIREQKNGWTNPTSS